MTRYRDDRYDDRSQNRDWNDRNDPNDRYAQDRYGDQYGQDRYRDDRSGMGGRGYGMNGMSGDRSRWGRDDVSRDLSGQNWDDRRGMGGMDYGDRYYSGQGGRSQGYQGQGYGMGGQDDTRSYGPGQGYGGQGGQRSWDDRQSQGRMSSQGYGMGQGRYGSDHDRSYGGYGEERGYNWDGLRRAGQGGGPYAQPSGYGNMGGMGRDQSSQYGPSGYGMGGQYGSQYGQESYRGRGPSGYQRSDERIKEQVNDALEDDDRVDASDITVQLQNGEVTLSGTVKDRHQKRAAEDCVERVRGVKDVHNQLRVQGDQQGQNQSGMGMGAVGSSSASNITSSNATGSAAGTPSTTGTNRSTTTKS